MNTAQELKTRKEPLKGMQKKHAKVPKIQPKDVLDIACELTKDGKCSKLIAVRPVYLMPQLEKILKKDVNLLVNKTTTDKIREYMDEMGKLKQHSHISEFEVKEAGTTFSLRLMLSSKDTFLLFAANITQQKFVEREHAKLHQQVHDILESVTDGFISVDSTWTYRYLNDHAASLSNNKKENLIGRSMFKVHPNFGDTIFYKKYKESMERKKVLKFEFFYDNLDRWYGVSVYPAQDGISVYFTDITQTKNYLKKISESEERHRLMIENIKDYAIFMLDHEGYITTWNEGAERTLGYTEKEVLNTHFGRFFILDDMMRRKPKEGIGLAKRNGRMEREGWRKRKNGAVFWADEIITAVYDETKNLRGFSVLIRDISERKKAEEALIERSRDLEITKAQIELEKAQDEALLESIGEGVVATDNKGRIMFMNHQAEEMLAVKTSEAQKKHYYEVWTTWSEDDEVISHNRCPISLVLRTGKKFINTDYVFSTKHRKKFPAATTAAPVIFGKKTVGAIIVFRDIRKEKEIDRAKSEFVSLASHQLRTPLTAIKLFVEMLTSNSIGGLNSDQRDILESIEDSNQKMIQLVDDLLNVSRLEARRLKIDLAPVDLVSFVRNILNNSEIQTQTRKSKLKFKSANKQLMTQTDVNLVNQVVNNLVSNAVQYTKPGDSRIEVGVTKWNSKNYCISVKDNGIGVPKHAQKKIFTKLYRADNAIKARTDGNGLGLYMCKMIVDEIGGKIWFTSQEGKGTTFYVLIPIKK